MHKSTKFRQRGLSLIEVLISLVIFGFGLLAAAGLQLASLKSSQFSAQAVVGTNFARDLGEMMQVVPNYAASTTSGTSVFFVNTNNTTTAVASACTGTAKTCTPAELATSLVADWSQRVKQGLPGGRAEVCRDSTPRDASGNLEWGGCDDSGQMTLVKVGWVGKSNAGSDTQSTGMTWMTQDRPRLALEVLGNSSDYAAGDAQ
jgi:type IV pilus assembly protein PilV